MLNVLDTFSGIGGFSLGLERTGGFRTVAFCEIEPYCQAVLRKHWPGVPIHEDIRKLDGRSIGPIDVVCGGFPCQPWSVAGKRRGTEDDRDLWPQMRRLVADIRPRWVVGENVPGLDDEQFMGLDRVLSDLEGLGYSAVPIEIPACAVDAPHRRARLWIVAHAESGRGNGQGFDCQRQEVSSPCEPSAKSLAHGPRHGGGEPETCGTDRERTGTGGDEDHVADSQRGGCSPAGQCRRMEGIRNERTHDTVPAQERSSRDVEHAPIDGRGEGRPEPEIRSGRTALAEPSGAMGDATSEGLAVGPGIEGNGGAQFEAAERAGHWRDCEWIGGRRVKPGVRLLATRVPDRVAKLRALGNAVVPQVVEKIGLAILEAEREAT